MLAERPPAWHLMVGDGPLRGRRRGGVDEDGRPAIACGSWPTRADVGDVLAASDVLLFGELVREA